MTAEQQGSDESGEGLTEADLTPNERGQIMSGRVDGVPVGHVAAAVHVFADRLAAVQAERDRMAGFRDECERQYQVKVEELGDAEAALATARRDADELRGRLAAVEAVLSRMATTGCDVHKAARCGCLLREARAALANPSAAQGDPLSVPMGEQGWVSHRSPDGVDGARHTSSETCPWCPSAAQGEGEVEHRTTGVYGFGDYWPADTLATDADGSGQ